MPKFTQLRDMLVQNIVATPRNQDNLTSNNDNSVTTEWQGMISDVLTAIKTEKNNKRAKQQYQLLKVLLGPTSGHYRDISNPAHHFILQNKSAQTHFRLATANALNEITPILIDIASIDKALLTCLTQFNAIQDKSQDDIEILNKVSAAYHQFQLALSNGLGDYIAWRKDNDAQLEEIKQILPKKKKLRVSYKDQALKLSDNIKLHVSHIVENTILATAKNLPWDNILDKTADETYKLTDQINYFVEEHKTKIVTEILECKNASELRKKIENKVSKFRKKKESIQKKKRHKKLIDLVLKNPQNNALFTIYPLVKQKLEKTHGKDVTYEEDSFTEFYKSADAISDFNLRKKVKLQLGMHKVDKAVESTIRGTQAAKLAEAIENSETNSEVGILTWTQLYAGFYHLKYSSDLQAEIKTDLQFYIKDILSKAQKDKIKIDEATNIALRRCLQYLLACLTKANDFELDQTILFSTDMKKNIGLTAALSYLDKINNKATPVTNLKSILVATIENIKAGDVLYLAANDETSLSEMLLEKAKHQPNQLSAVEQYQLYCHYQTYLQFIKTSSSTPSKNYFEYLHTSLHYLVLAAHGDSKAALKRLGQNTRVTAIELAETLENSFITALKTIDTNSRHYAPAQVQLFVLYYGRRYKKIYSDYQERLRDLEEAISCILTPNAELMSVKKELLKLLGQENNLKVDASFLAKLTLSLELAGFDPFAVMYKDITKNKDTISSHYPFQIKPAPDLSNLTHNKNDIKEILESRDEIITERQVFIKRNSSGRYEIKLTKEDLVTPIIFFDRSTRIEIGRVSFVGSEVVFHGYGNKFNIKLEKIDTVNQLTINNENGKVDLSGDFSSQNDILISGKLKEFNLHGKIHSDKNFVCDVTGILSIAEDALITANHSTIIKARDCEVSGKILAKENLSLQLQEAAWINTTASCSADKELTIDANALVSKGGSLQAETNLNIKTKNSIYLKNTKVDSKANISIDAESFMVDGKASINAADCLKVTTADKWICENNAALSAKTLQAKSKTIDNYSSQLSFDAAYINATDCFTNYANGVITTQKLLHITGDNFWNSGKIHFGDNCVIKLNKLYVHGIAEIEGLISYFKNKWESSGSLIEGKQINITAGAYIKVCSLEAVHNRYLTALAELDVALRFSLFNNTTSILALNVGLDLPNAVAMYKEIKSFVSLIQEGKSTEALSALCTMETALKGASAVRWLLQTFLPKLGKPINLSWSALMLLINTPSVISQIMTLYKQYQAGENLQAYQFYSLLTIAFSSLNQGLSIHSQIANLSSGLGNNTIGNTNWASAIGVNLASLFLPMNVQNSLISVNVADVLASYSIQNTSALSFSKWNVRTAMSISDIFYAAVQDNIDAAYQRSVTANTLVESGRTYADIDLFFVNNLVKQGVTVAKTESVQGVNATFAANSQEKVTHLNVQMSKQASVEGSMQVESANLKSNDMKVTGSIVSNGHTDKTTPAISIQTSTLEMTKSSEVKSDAAVIINTTNGKVDGNLESANTFVKANKNLKLTGAITTGELEIAAGSKISSKGHLTFDFGNIQADKVKDDSDTTINSRPGPKLANPDAPITPDLTITGTNVKVDTNHLHGKEAAIAISGTNSAEISGRAKVHEIIAQAPVINTHGHLKADAVYLNSKTPDGIVNVADSLKARIVGIEANAVNATANVKANELAVNAGKSIAISGEVDAYNVSLKTSDAAGNVTLSNSLKAHTVDVQSNTVNDGATIEAKEFAVAANKSIAVSKEIDAKKVFLKTSDAAGDIDLSNSIKSKRLSVFSGNTLEATATIETEKGVLHAQNISASATFEVDPKAKTLKPADDGNAFAPLTHSKSGDPALVISADGLNSLTGAIKANGRSVAIEGTVVDTSANINARKLVIEAKTELNVTAPMEFKKGYISAAVFTDSSDITVDKDPKTPPPPGCTTGPQPLKPAVNPDLTIQAPVTSIEGGHLTGPNAIVAIQSTTADLDETVSDVHKLFITAEKEADLGNTITGDEVVVNAPVINDNAKIIMPDGAKNPEVAMQADTLNMGSQSSITGKGGALLQAHTGNLTNIDVQDLGIKLDHIDDILDLIQSSGPYANVHGRNSLSISTLDDVSIQKDLDINFSLAITAARIALSSNIHSTKDLSFNAILGDVTTTNDKVMADGVLSIDAIGGYTNNGGIVGGGAMFVHTVGNITNTAGTLCSPTYTQIISDMGSLLNVATQNSVQGPVGTMQAYHPAQIIGGSGVNTDGEGLHIEVGNKIDNDASIMSSAGSNYLKAANGISSTARANRYVSYHRTWDNIWQDKETTVVSTQVQTSGIVSTNGSNTLISTSGAIYSSSTTFSAKDGNHFTAQGPITFTGLVTSDVCVKDSNAAFGLLHDNEKLTEQYAIPSVVIDLSNSSIVSLSDIKIENAVILSPGTLTLSGKNVTISAPILNDKYTADSIAFKIILPGASSIPGFGASQDLQGMFNSTSSASFAASAWNFGVDSLNFVNNAISAYRAALLATSLAENLGAISNVFCPSVGVGIDYSQTKDSWQTVAPNVGMQVGGLNIVAMDKVAFKNGVSVNVEGNAAIVANDIEFKGAKLESSSSFNDVGVSASINLAGKVSGGANEASSGSKQETWANMHMNIEGTATFVANKMDMKAADITAGQVAGAVGQLNIKSELNTGSSHSQSASVSTDGNFSVNNSSSKVDVIGEVSGIKVSQGINVTGGPKFVVGSTTLVSAKITSGGENNFETGTLTTKTLNETNKTNSFGITGNAKALFGGGTCPTNLPISSVSRGEQNIQDVQNATVNGRGGTHLSASSVKGYVNTTNGSGRVITKDVDQQITVRIPEPGLLSETEHNLEWAEQQRTGLHVQGPSVQQGNTPDDNRPQTAAQRQEDAEQIALTERVLSQTQQIMDQDPGLNVSRANGEDVREADQPQASAGTTDKWGYTPAPSKDWNPIYDNSNSADCSSLLNPLPPPSLDVVALSREVETGLAKLNQERQTSLDELIVKNAGLRQDAPQMPTATDDRQSIIEGNSLMGQFHSQMQEVGTQEKHDSEVATAEEDGYFARQYYMGLDARYNITNRGLGLIQAAGGIMEVGLSIGAAASSYITGPLGISAAGFLAGDGLDNLSTGAMQLITGKSVTTGFVSTLNLTGVSERTAGMIQAGVGIIATGALGLCSFFSKAAVTAGLAEKTIGSGAEVSGMESVNLAEGTRTANIELEAGTLNSVHADGISGLKEGSFDPKDAATGATIPESVATREVSGMTGQANIGLTMPDPTKYSISQVNIEFNPDIAQAYESQVGQNPISEVVGRLSEGMPSTGRNGFFGEGAGNEGALANTVESFFTKAAYNGELYPKDKLIQLVKYLEQRGISVFGADRNPAFVARSDGTGMMLLPENPTILQIKHELSHYLDFKKLGYENYVSLGRANREALVLERLQNNRVWEQLNAEEKQFSIDYVKRLMNTENRNIQNERSTIN